MTKASIKIVRPWPAEQPRPPITHRMESTKAASMDQANRPRAEKTKTV